MGNEPTAEKKNAIQAFDEILPLIKGKQLVIFFDYDGTLAPIAIHPALAILSDEMKETLRALSEKYSVAIISGRDLIDVREHVKLDHLYYAGSHGFDMEGPEGYRYENDEWQKFSKILDQAANELNSRLEWFEGAWLEKKKFALATHYREVDPAIVPIVELAVKEVQALHPELRKTDGKKIFELVPDIDWHKGKAVHWLLHLLGFDAENVLPLYIGDDLTDEDAFRELQEGGLGIAVQDEPTETAAHYTLMDPQEVRKFMQLLIEA